MNVAEIISNPYLGLSATDRLILLTLAGHTAGLRTEEIARLSGSRYRWVARQVSAPVKMGLLRRIGPSKYALNDCSKPLS